MAIGVSYMGHDGRRMDFSTEGNPTPGSQLDNLVRGGTANGNPLAPLAEQMRRARHPQAPDPRIDKAAGTVKLDESDRRPGSLADKLKSGGSIEASPFGLCLKGEGTGKVAGNGIYAKNGEKQGFLSLDEIDDPNAKGAQVGEADVNNRLSPSNKTSSEKDGAYSVNMQSRTEAEVNEDTGEVTFWEYTKKWSMTNGRRVGEVSGETKRKICSFFLGSERQITYTRTREPFTVVRSHYVDANGKTQYEFWAKCLKWGSNRNDSNGYAWNFASEIAEYDLSTNRIIGNNSNTNGYERPYDGAYAFGEYGHYPRRPSNRPRKLEFDSGREALVDLFEEKDRTAGWHDENNVWTYIGGSEDCEILGKSCSDGNIELFGAFFDYFVPFKTTYTNPVSDTYVSWYFGGDLYIWCDPGFYYSYAGHWNYKWATQFQMVVVPEELNQHELFLYLRSKGALVSLAYNNDDYDKNYWEKKYRTTTGEVLIDAIRSPDCNENYPFQYWSDGWHGACLDTDAFPSIAHLEKSLNEKCDYLSHDYTVYDHFSYWSSYRQHFYYPNNKSGFLSLGIDEKVKSNIATESNKLYGPFNDSGYKSFASDWDLFWNYRTYKREKYNGNWMDYFPFFIGINYNNEYFWHDYGWSPTANPKTLKICEIKDWKIVENSVGNTYCFVAEDAKGKIVKVELKNFGDIVRVGGKKKTVESDIVFIER